MLNFNTNKVVADNEVIINGHSFGMLTDTDTEKLIGIIKGMQSGQPTGTKTYTASSTAKAEKPSKSDFPTIDHGKALETVGFVSRYDGNVVTYWDNGFVPNKVKYGIKMSLKDAGAEWSAEKGGFVFKTKKACDEYMKAQKARQTK